MPSGTLNFLCQKYLGSAAQLTHYYDFTFGGTSTSGPPYTGFILNKSSNLNNPLFAIQGTGTAPIDATLATLAISNGGSFLLSESNLYTTGLVGVPLNNCTFAFQVEKTGRAAGVLFGLQRRLVTAFGGNNYVSSRGFNIGLNSRNRLFFQTIGPDGEKMICSDIELANKNICAVTISNGAVTFKRFDLPSNSFEYQDFYINTDYIVDNLSTDAIYIGGSSSYFGTSGQKTFSGMLNELAIFSGAIDGSVLKNIVSGFFGTMVGIPAVITTGYEFTGRSLGVIYPTGITGYTVTQTGTLDLPMSGAYRIYGWTSGLSGVTEGQFFPTGFELNSFGDKYIEKEGFLSGNNIYQTTGDMAWATKGLTGGNFSATGFSQTISNFSPNASGIPLFSLTPLTGFLYEYPSGTGLIDRFRQFPVLVSPASTGVSGTVGDVTGQMYDSLYFLGPR